MCIRSKGRGAGGVGAAQAPHPTPPACVQHHARVSLTLIGHIQGGIVKPVRTPVAILGSLGVCIYVPASRHGLISYSPIHLI